MFVFIIGKDLTFILFNKNILAKKQVLFNVDFLKAENENKLGFCVRASICKLLYQSIYYCHRHDLSGMGSQPGFEIKIDPFSLEVIKSFPFFKVKECQTCHKRFQLARLATVFLKPQQCSTVG